MNTARRHPGGFPVPLEDIFVSLSTKQPRQKLPAGNVTRCIDQFYEDLAKEPTDDIMLVTKLNDTELVTVNITPLSGVSGSRSLTYGMATRVIFALGEYLDYFQLYEALAFAVVERNTRRRIAVGRVQENTHPGTDANLTPIDAPPTRARLAITMGDFDGLKKDVDTLKPLAVG
ncbi:MAG: hypothetical protein Q9163_005286 [Psora crenata]